MSATLAAQVAATLIKAQQEVRVETRITKIRLDKALKELAKIRNTTDRHKKLNLRNQIRSLERTYASYNARDAAITEAELGAKSTESMIAINKMVEAFASQFDTEQTPKILHTLKENTKKLENQIMLASDTDESLSTANFTMQSQEYSDADLDAELDEILGISKPSKPAQNESAVLQPVAC